MYVIKSNFYLFLKTHINEIAFALAISALANTVVYGLPKVQSQGIYGGWRDNGNIYLLVLQFLSANTWLGSE
jgi:hypothetical protein